jgi:hypothetical protein
MKEFAMILSRLCDDDDLKRKSMRLVDVELPVHVCFKMVEVLAKHDISVFMGVIRITQMWNFYKLERAAQHVVKSILLSKNDNNGTLSDEKICCIVQSFLRDEEWAQLIPDHMASVRNMVLTLAAAKLQGQDDIFDFSIVPSLRHVNVEAMRNEPWTASAFELLATELAVQHRRNMICVNDVAKALSQSSITRPLSNVLDLLNKKTFLDPYTKI